MLRAGASTRVPTFSILTDWRAGSDVCQPLPGDDKNSSIALFLFQTIPYRKNYKSFIQTYGIKTQTLGIGYDSHQRLTPSFFSQNQYNSWLTVDAVASNKKKKHFIFEIYSRKNLICYIDEFSLIIQTSINLFQGFIRVVNELSYLYLHSYLPFLAVAECPTSGQSLTVKHFSWLYGTIFKKMILNIPV